MLEFEQNEELDPTTLADFFVRLGWKEPEGARRIEWVIEASDDWVVCRLEGEMVGFGRTFRLDPQRKIMFDVLVDERFRALGLVEEIMRRLTQGVSTLTEFQVFRREQQAPWPLPGEVGLRYSAPEASPDTYTGPDTYTKG